MTAEGVLIAGGRVIDLSRRLDSELDVLVRSGTIVRIARSIPKSTAERRVDASGCLVVPGLIDLHAHVSRGLGGVGIDIDPVAARSGVTTVVDAGTAGTEGYEAFRDSAIKHARTRVLAFLNINAGGITARDLIDEPLDEPAEELLAPKDAIIAVFERNRDTLCGLKLRLDHRYRYREEEYPLQFARDLADRLVVPLMVHAYAPPPTVERILSNLRAGDILTHTYSRHVGIVTPNGDLHPAAVAARRRGVLFDVGHGSGSFDFTVAHTALGHGFAPDTISTDLHIENACDLLTTMTKLRHLGLPLAEVVRAVTAGPAQALALTQRIGGLGPGCIADITLLRVDRGRFPIEDTSGAIGWARERFACAGIVRNGVPEAPALPGSES